MGPTNGNPEKRVLVVEDDHSIRTGIKLLLEYEGYKVEEASTSTEGCDKALAADPPYDLIIQDNQLTDTGEGWDAMYRTVTQGNVDSSILFMTGEIGSVHPTTRLSIQQLGHRASWILKPYDGDEFVGKVEQLTDASAANNDIPMSVQPSLDA